MYFCGALLKKIKKESAGQIVKIRDQTTRKLEKIRKAVKITKMGRPIPPRFGGLEGESIILTLRSVNSIGEKWNSGN
jgi:hypothetical protein